jgi:hypothetical protein
MQLFLRVFYVGVGLYLKFLISSEMLTSRTVIYEKEGNSIVEEEISNH